MQLPSDVQQALERMKQVAAVDELRKATQLLQAHGHLPAAKLLAARADKLSAELNVTSKPKAAIPPPPAGVRTSKHVGGRRLVNG